MTFSIGQEVTIQDRARPWAHGETGRILACYPPGSESPQLYEVLVAGRPLQAASDTLKEE